MNHNLALIIALAAPALVLVVLRVNAAMVFLSLCLGAVLVQYVASQATDLLKLASPHAGSLTVSGMQLILLLAPAVVTALVTIFSVHGRIKSLVNILPSAAASALTVLLAVPLLAPGLRLKLESQAAWRTLSRAEAMVVGAGALISLVFLWTQRRGLREYDKRKHKS